MVVNGRPLIGGTAHRPHERAEALASMALGDRAEMVDDRRLGRQPVVAVREQLLDAGQKTFHEKGFNGAGVQDITDAALVIGDWPARKKVIDVALHKYLTAEGERRVRAVPGDDEDGRRSISLVRVAARYAG